MKGFCVLEAGCDKVAEMAPVISLWQPPLQKPVLEAGELHLWRFKLNTVPRVLENLKAPLNNEEVLRAARLLDPRKENQFIRARTCLRQILEFYLESPAARIKFQYDMQGKPSLADDHLSSLSFNLSHSGEWGILAIIKGYPVGVDIELIETALDYAQLTGHYFDPWETQILSQYPSEKRRRGFYRLWTRKEAVLKMLGTGFTERGTEERKPAFVQHVHVAAGYVSVVATTSPVLSVVRYHFSE